LIYLVSGIKRTLCIAQYFLIKQELGSCPKWLGNFNGWHQLEGQCYAFSIAERHVWAAASYAAKDQAFNHGISDTIVWPFLWMLFGEFFGGSIEGAEPGPGDGGSSSRN
jgi:hypothetical protein